MGRVDRGFPPLIRGQVRPMSSWGRQIKASQADWDTVFGQAVQDGLSIVELRAPTRRGETMSQTDAFSDHDDGRAISSIASMHGIELAYHAPQGEAWCFGKLAHKDAVERLRECILRAESLQAKHMTLHLGIDVNRPRDDSIRQGACALMEVSPMAKEKGVALCVENVFSDGSSVASPIEVQLLLEKAPSEAVFFTLDTGHANMYRCIYEMLDIAGSRLAFTHIHDNDGLNDQHLVPGHGIIDWRRFMRKLDAVQYNGPLCLELREAGAIPDILSVFLGL